MGFENSIQRSECGLRDRQYHLHEFFLEEMKRKNEEEETKEWPARFGVKKIESIKIDINNWYKKNEEATYQRKAWLSFK